MKRSGSSKVVYHPLVLTKDIPHLDSVVRRRVKVAIELKLTTSPETYGEPLRGTLKQYWKLRVGSWRVVYAIRRKEVRVLLIAHRSKVYEEAGKRRA